MIVKNKERERGKKTKKVKENGDNFVIIGQEKKQRKIIETERTKGW